MSCRISRETILFYRIFIFLLNIIEKEKLTALRYMAVLPVDLIMKGCVLRHLEDLFCIMVNTVGIPSYSITHTSSCNANKYIKNVNIPFIKAYHKILQFFTQLQFFQLSKWYIRSKFKCNLRPLIIFQEGLSIRVQVYCFIWRHNVLRHWIPKDINQNLTPKTFIRHTIRGYKNVVNINMKFQLTMRNLAREIDKYLCNGRRRYRFYVWRYLQPYSFHVLLYSEIILAGRQ